MSVGMEVTAQLPDPEKTERGILELVKASVIKGAEELQDAVIGPQGTIRNAPGGLISPTIFRGDLVADLAKGPEIEDTGSTIIAKFGSSLAHAGVMEYGRRPGGKHPPIVGTKAIPTKTKTGKNRIRTVKISILDKWIERKIGPKGSSAKAVTERSSIAFLMGRKMKQKGMKGRHYLSRALKSNRRRIVKMINAEVARGLPKVLAASNEPVK